jgi:hypothetical protein
MGHFRYAYHEILGLLIRCKNRTRRGIEVPLNSRGRTGQDLDKGRADVRFHSGGAQYLFGDEDAALEVVFQKILDGFLIYDMLFLCAPAPFRCRFPITRSAPLFDVAPDTVPAVITRWSLS